jgi:hypothetical protein
VASVHRADVRAPVRNVRRWDIFWLPRIIAPVPSVGFTGRMSRWVAFCHGAVSWGRRMIGVIGEGFGWFGCAVSEGSFSRRGLEKERDGCCLHTTREAAEWVLCGGGGFRRQFVPFAGCCCG